jgi:hypothetical protein
MLLSRVHDGGIKFNVVTVINFLDIIQLLHLIKVTSSYHMTCIILSYNCAGFFVHMS